MQNKLRDIFRKITIDPLTGYMKIGNAFTKSHLKTYSPAAPYVADVDLYVTTTNMKVGAYTVAAASPGDALCRNVTVTTTAAGTADTQGTVLVTGTDYNSEVITETLTPVVGTTVAGKKAFKTVTNVVGAGWVINPDTPNNDSITVGFGNLIGMPEKISMGNIIFTVWNQVISATLPTFTYSEQVSLCTVTLPEAGNSAKKLIVFYTTYTGV